MKFRPRPRLRMRSEGAFANTPQDKGPPEIGYKGVLFSYVYEAEIARIGILAISMIGIFFADANDLSRCG